MTKFVCDFDAVRSSAISLTKVADNLISDVNSYSNAVKAPLNEWTGSASESFDNFNSDCVKKTLDYTEEIKSFGKFIKEAADKIEEVDNELASLDF